MRTTERFRRATPTVNLDYHPVRAPRVTIVKDQVAALPVHNDFIFIATGSM